MDRVSPPPARSAALVGHDCFLSNSITHTHGLASHEPGPLMDCQSPRNDSFAVTAGNPSWLSSPSYGFHPCSFASHAMPPGGFRSPIQFGSTPSAIASASLMSYNRSTRTALTVSVIREAQRGIWIDGVHRSGFCFGSSAL